MVHLQKERAALGLKYSEALGERAGKGRKVQ